MTAPTPSRFAFVDPPEGPERSDIDQTFVRQARAIAQICATRVLLMIAVLTGALIWAWTTYSPEPARLYVAIAFSLVFVLPQVALYWRRG